MVYGARFRGEGHDGNRTISHEGDKVVIDVSETFEVTLADAQCEVADSPTPPMPSIDGDNTFTTTRAEPGDSCITWRTTYPGAGGQVLRIQDSDPNTNDVQTILQDSLGSSRVVATDATGPVMSNRHSAWGETRDTAELPTDLGYTGQETVSNLPILYYNARWYDPTLGRFLQPDSG